MASSGVIFIIIILTFSASNASFKTNFHEDSKENEISDGPIKEKNYTNYLQQAKRGSKVWMGELGWIELTDDFYHIIYRPINFLPYSRETINTRFYLYTRSNPKETWILNADDKANMKSSPLDSRVPTIFIVHGFLDTKLYVKWMENLKIDLLLYRNYNVIIVDWSGGNQLPYTQATANTRVVGAEIALLINVLQKVKGVLPMDCHIIGHSLGAHIAGYAGIRLNKLGRISAVDPAEPYFQNMPPTVRLDPTDADFVDVIHTDSTSILLFGLGMSQAVGHVDFYPNEGRNQPGCKTDVFRSIFLDGLVEATRRFISCNHQRAVDFYTHSINYRRAPPVAYACTSWTDYTKGYCADCGKNGSKCAIMGIRANEYRHMKNDSQSVKLYVSTSGSAPYWVFHFQITLKLYRPKAKFSDQTGKITITLNGDLNNLKMDLSKRSMDLYHGATYKFLVTSSKQLGSIKSVTLNWQSLSWNIFKTKALYIEYLKVVPMNIIDAKEKKKQERIFRDKPEKAIKPGQNVVLGSTWENTKY